MPASSRNYIYKVSYTIYCICSLYTPTTCKDRCYGLRARGAAFVPGCSRWVFACVRLQTRHERIDRSPKLCAACAQGSDHHITV